MDYTVIDVPDLNDSVSRIVISETVYFIRFTYNDTGAYWKFGLYDSQNNAIVQGIKIVPNFPLNLFCGVAALPYGVFGAMTKKERIERNDFVDGNAKFVYIPAET